MASNAVILEVSGGPTQTAFGNSSGRFPLMCSGMGAGKSHILRKKFLRRVSENHRLMTRKSPAFYLAPTYDMVHNLIVPNLDDDLTQLGIPHKFSDGGHLLELTWRQHKTFTRLLSAENYERYMGSEIPFMMGDELELCFRANATKIEHMWRKLLSRLRVKGSSQSFDVASTPEGFGFLWSWWEDRIKKHPEVRADYQLYQCSTYENRANLPPDYIPTLLRDYPKALIEAYLYGRFVNLTAGAVYHAFDRQRHVGSGLRLVPGLPIEFDFDFNVDPCTAVIGQYREPDFVVVDCIQDRSGKGTSELCRRLLQQFGDFPGPALIYGDATGKAKDSTSGGRSDRDIIDQLIGRAWAQRGYDTRWTTRNPWPPDRYASVNGILEADRAVIDERAEGLITDLTRGVFKPGTRVEDDQNGTIGHASSAWGYRIFRDYKVGRTLDERLRVAA